MKPLRQSSREPRPSTGRSAPRVPKGLRPFLWALVGFFAGISTLSSYDVCLAIEPSRLGILPDELMQQLAQNINLTISTNSSSVIPSGSESSGGNDSKLFKRNRSRESSGKRSLALFYHTFSGPTEENKQLTLKILDQQLKIIGQAAAQSAQLYDWTVYYRSVGEAGVVTEAFVEGLCEDYDLPSCVYQGHSGGGHEELSLQALHRYCQHNPNDTVVYIHTKGSLHNHQMNRLWRGPLTMAAMKESCFQNFRSDVCNVCGLQFYPVWSPMIPGNMWSSTCSYIQDLKDPMEYRALLTEAVDFSVNNKTLFQHEMYKPYFPKQWDDIIGIKRYTNEAWVSSHPSIKPCDTSQYRTGIFPNLRGFSKKNFVKSNDAKSAPRVPLEEGNWFRFDPEIYREVVQTDGQRPHEWHLLPGILYRHWHVYKSFPPADSWIWKYYPNGKMWFKRIQNATAEGKDWRPDLIW